MGMWDFLTTPWETPSVDSSDSLTRSCADYFKTLSNSPSEIQEAIMEKNLEISAAVAYSTKLLQAEQATIDKTISNLNSMSGAVAYDDGTIVFLKNESGIITLEDTVGNVKQYDDATFNKVDPSDQSDFDSRYVSIDAPFYNGDQPSISFFRILNTKTTPMKQVFPKANSQPGITETKYKQFILSSVNTGSAERMQIVETSQEFQVLFYGKKPEMLNLSGVLKNTVDNPWTANVVFLWDEMMRGTALVEAGNIMELYIDGDVYRGYPFNFNRSKISPTDFIVSFSMSFLIKDRYQTKRNFL